MSATTTLPPTFSPKAVIFDAYGTLFDVHSVVAAAEQMFPGHGNALSQLWRQKQIEYTQLRTLADPAGAHYQPFWNITLDALRFAAHKLGLTLNRAAEKRLMDEYACLSAFPDAVPALRQLHDRRNQQARRESGVPGTADATDIPGAPLGLAILSNGNPQMLDIAVKSAGMCGLFDHVLSVDTVRAYKPASAAYSLGPQAFGAAPGEIVFVSSNGWDAAGANWFGYTTFWLNRQGAPAEELGVTPHGTGSSMNELLVFLQSLAAPDGSRNRTRHSPGV
jgi:2-haloacid dehalogenase